MRISGFQPPVEVREPDSNPSLHQILYDIEGYCLAWALEQTGGNKNQAALMLGLQRSTLVMKLHGRKQRQRSRDGRRARCPQVSHPEVLRFLHKIGFLK